MFQKYKSQTSRMQTNRLKQCGYLLGAVMVMLSLLVTLLPGHTDAYGMVTNRSIELGSTQTSATNVAYRVNFTTVTSNANIGSVVVKFCENTPILGDGCDPPDGFDTRHNDGLTLNNVTGPITGLSLDTTNSTDNVIVLTRGTASTVATPGAVSFTFGNGTTNGITNPSTNGTFYARIIVFSSTDGAGNELTGSIDAGGIAMSTANQLNVTAKVQEAIFFCVYTEATCEDGGQDVVLGDSNGVLSSNTTTYTDTAKFDIASNAVSGVSIRVKGDTLKSGSFSISPYGAACDGDSNATGTEQFGLRIETAGVDTTASAPYNCNTGEHGFDVTNTTSEFGDEIAATSGATDVSTSTIEFAAKSANTSEAGIYTTALMLIATATY